MLNIGELFGIVLAHTSLWTPVDNDICSFYKFLSLNLATPDVDNINYLENLHDDLIIAFIIEDDRLQELGISPNTKLAMETGADKITFEEVRSPCFNARSGESHYFYRFTKTTTTKEWDDKMKEWEEFNE